MEGEGVPVRKEEAPAAAAEDLAKGVHRGGAAAIFLKILTFDKKIINFTTAYLRKFEQLHGLPQVVLVSLLRSQGLDLDLQFGRVLG